jgi:hypothetical protein
MAGLELNEKLSLFVAIAYSSFLVNLKSKKSTTIYYNSGIRKIGGIYVWF